MGSKITLRLKQIPIYPATRMARGKITAKGAMEMATMQRVGSGGRQHFDGVMMYNECMIVYAHVLPWFMGPFYQPFCKRCSLTRLAILPSWSRKSLAKRGDIPWPDARLMQRLEPGAVVGFGVGLTTLYLVLYIYTYIYTFYTIPYHTICIIPYCTVLYHALICRSMLYYSTPSYPILSYSILSYICCIYLYMIN